MSIISCLKCVVSQSNVCLVLKLVVAMSCHRGLVNELDVWHFLSTGHVSLHDSCNYYLFILLLFFFSYKIHHIVHS